MVADEARSANAAACDHRHSTIIFALCAASQSSSVGLPIWRRLRIFAGFKCTNARSGVQPPTINGSVSALRFFFTITLDRPDLSRRLVLARVPRKLPAVLSVEEVGRLLEAAPGPKCRAALGIAGAGAIQRDGSRCISVKLARGEIAITSVPFCRANVGIGLALVGSKRLQHA
jgi:hypothetical protein